MNLIFFLIRIALKNEIEALEKEAIDKYKSQEEGRWAPEVPLLMTKVDSLVFQTEKKKAEEALQIAERNEQEALEAFLDLDSNQDEKWVVAPEHSDVNSREWSKHLWTFTL